MLVENELNELSEKVKLLSSKDYSFLLGRIYFTSDGRFQKVFVDEPTFTMIKYKNMSAEYVISWKSKAVYNSKPITLNSSFLLNIKYFFIKGLQFNNTSLVIEQNNYTRKILNVYIVYDLDLLHWICDNQRFKIRKINSVNALYLIFNKVNGYFEEINGNKYLTQVSSNESKENIKKYEQ